MATVIEIEKALQTLPVDDAGKVGRDSWIGFPAQLTNGNNLKVKMKAIFRVKKGWQAGLYDAPVFGGRIESQPVECRIFDSRLKWMDPLFHGE